MSEEDKQNLGEKIREAEVKNILKKLMEGKTLNGRESRVAHEYAEAKAGKRTEEIPPSVDVNTLADLFGITTVWVQRLAKDGVIVKTERGRYDLFPSIRGYLKHLQERRANQWEGEEGSDYEAHRARLTGAKADVAEITAAIAKGQAHDAGAVEAVWTDMLMNCRSKLLAMPTRLAPKLRKESGLAVVKDILETAITEALTELAAYDPARVTNEYLSKHRVDVAAAPEVDGEPVGG